MHKYIYDVYILLCVFVCKREREPTEITQHVRLVTEKRSKLQILWVQSIQIVMPIIAMIMVNDRLHASFWSQKPHISSESLTLKVCACALWYPWRVQLTVCFPGCISLLSDVCLYKDIFNYSPFSWNKLNKTVPLKKFPFY